MKCSVSVDPVGCARLKTQRKRETACVCVCLYKDAIHSNRGCKLLATCDMFLLLLPALHGQRNSENWHTFEGSASRARARTPVLHSRQSEWALAEASQLWQYVWLTRVTGGPEPAKRSPTGRSRRQPDGDSSLARSVSRKGPHGLATTSLSSFTVGRRSTGHELGLRRSISYCLRCTWGEGLATGTSRT